ncbi:MAG: exodeoxyribonuclease VII small subunit [Ruminococcaceae bacterium]|nr:exodeoxyribonuclease VII small subunit [Oscillospiraceae bacterium]
MENKNEKFEVSMKRLDDIVRSLENGSADLDSALALYEEGIGLVRKCGKMLDDAEKKIKILQSDGEGNMTERDFEAKDE